MWEFERENTFNQFNLTEDEINKYAELEHQRWCTYQLIEGYYPWKYDDFIQSCECTTVYSTRDEKRRLHACITDWNTIQKIDDEIGSCYAEYNKRYIKMIPNIITGFNGEFGYQYEY